MITVGMNYNIIQGKDDEFLAVFTKVIQIMKRMPGTAKLISTGMCTVSTIT